jgi:hypothetical protein
MVKQSLAVLAVGAVLFGCSTGKFSEVAPRGGWRAEAERACMDRRSGVQTVAASASPTAPGAQTASAGKYSISGPTIVEIPAIIEDPCGIDYPLKVSALVDGQTAFDPAVTLGCPMTEALDAWLRESVQPAAIEWIGSPVVEIDELSNYACRKRNNVGSGYSEHAFGNALDISGFRFANGQQLVIAKDWKGSPKAEGFFREIFATACQRFTTVLGPGSNMLHYNHIHIDLALVAPDKSPKMCKPWPVVTPPQRTPVEGSVVAAARGGSPVVPAAEASPNATSPAAASSDAVSTVPRTN